MRELDDTIGHLGKAEPIQGIDFQSKMYDLGVPVYSSDLMTESMNGIVYAMAQEIIDLRKRVEVLENERE